jgi:hypothetical protein
VHPAGRGLAGGGVSEAAGPADRVRTLLLRGDNLLKSGRPERLPRALEAFQEARQVARDPAVDVAVRHLVERRLEALRALTEAQG